MPEMKITQKYFFSVEGETEKWYLDWLKNKINNEPSAKFKVNIDSRIEKNPLKRVKSINFLSKIEITHLVDYESNDEEHKKQFINSLDKLKAASRLGKQIKYNLGYSNFTFELWMVLHKTNCSAPIANRFQYLELINKAYDKKYKSLGEYKQENNFKDILEKISFDDVKAAIERAKIIMQNNKENGLVIQKYKGYEYYKENPSLSIWRSIEKIMKDCKLV